MIDDSSSAAEPQPQPGFRYVAVARVGEIPPITGKACKVGDRRIALFQDAGRYYALDDFCPHQGAPLNDGLVFDGTVMCKHHGWRFHLDTGRWASARRACVKTYPVRVVGEEIQVEVPDDTQA